MTICQIYDNSTTPPVNTTSEMQNGVCTFTCSTTNPGTVESLGIMENLAEAYGEGGEGICMVDLCNAVTTLCVNATTADEDNDDGDGGPSVVEVLVGLGVAVGCALAAAALGYAANRAWRALKARAAKKKTQDAKDPEEPMEPEEPQDLEWDSEFDNTYLPHAVFLHRQELNAPNDEENPVDDVPAAAAAEEAPKEEKKEEPKEESDDDIGFELFD